MIITDVAVGVLIRNSAEVLYAQRLEGKPYAGWWEFPGGKHEPQETMRQTLDRELAEELGIQVQEAHHWVIRDHVYPHATVRLWFFKVVQWLGEPKSAEGQNLAWRPLNDHSLEPILPAAIAVLPWLCLPPCLPISRAQMAACLAQPQQNSILHGFEQLGGFRVCSNAIELSQAAQAQCQFVILNAQLDETTLTQLAVQSRVPVYTLKSIGVGTGLVRLID
jgi:8-oxo-dGTP diphosphatase